MNYTVQIWTSFPKIPTGGNKAGVCMLDEQCSLATMQYIATEMKLSETAFVRVLGEHRVEVRFFTPTMEVPLCGHATVAVFAYLQQIHGYQPGVYTMQGVAGERTVTITETGMIRLEQDILQIQESLENTDVLQFTDLEEDDLWEGFTGAVVSVGLPIAVLGIRSCGTLVSMEVNEQAIATYLEKHNAAILYIVSQQVACLESTIQGRMFAPQLGIMDEPATGMAAGAAGAYLFDQQILAASTIIVEQGYSTGQPSEIIVKIKGTPQEITGIAVEGRATFREERVVHSV